MDIDDDSSFEPKYYDPKHGPPVLPPGSDGRRRYVGLEWPRDPKGPIIKPPQPTGTRTANGLIWGHSLEDFLWVNRWPNGPHKVMMGWSRSMIKEIGEDYHEAMFSTPDSIQVPRLRRPWPVLKLEIPRLRSDVPIHVMDCDDATRKQLSLLGAMDVGCDHYDGQYELVLFRKDDFDDDPDPIAKTDAEAYQEALTFPFAYCQPFIYKLNGGLPDPRILGDNIVRVKVTKNMLKAPYLFKSYAFPSGAKPPRDSPFSTEEIPKLEEFIPDNYFPDFLMVHDPHHVTYSAGAFRSSTAKGSNTRAPPPRKYKRLYPVLPRDKEPASTEEKPDLVGHLYLHRANYLGKGHHSLVHRAPMTLPWPLSAYSRNGRVTVAAKTAVPLQSARTLLQNEAEVYKKMPKHLMEEWCGYHLVVPIKYPVPSGAVVPKLLGYYVPVEEEADKALQKPVTRDCEEIMGERGERDTILTTHSPLLLLEECGTPIRPRDLDLDQKCECFSLMFRLHHAQILQNSFYVRNILWQPGPLTAPPEKRSKDTPSFRIIDFGRAVEKDLWEANGRSAAHLGREGDWQKLLHDEERAAEHELRIEDY